MVANILEVRIVILESKDEKYVLSNRELIYGNQFKENTIFLCKRKDHYDSLIEKKERPRRISKPTFKVQNNADAEKITKNTGTDDIKNKLTQTIRLRDATIKQKNEEIYTFGQIIIFLQTKHKIKTITLSI